ncbi:hypothetical protein LTR53_002238 [Teratosphaeriaceae sp. CCFEE 6253]|nr:hypothetical protein LTR53_002238 [Teratosphaeriaceae sp. CCFEE 6253]
MPDTIDASFTEGYNEAKKLYDDDDLEGCIEKARELLAEPAIPRYHRMKTLILLGSTLGDWEEAEECRVRAEAIWRIVRRWQPEGQDVEVDAAMKELREALEDLHVAIKDEQPKGYDPETDVNQFITQNDAEVADAQAIAQADQDDPEALELADQEFFRTQKQMGDLAVGSAKPSASGGPSSQIPIEVSSGASDVQFDEQMVPRREPPGGTYVPPRTRGGPFDSVKRREKEERMRSSSWWR